MNSKGTIFETLIDTADLEKINSFPNKWYPRNTTSGVYVYSLIMKKGRSKMFWLHRLIMDTPDGLVVDHINHCPLDNRKKNLRNITPRENGMHRKGSPFPGPEVYQL